MISKATATDLVLINWTSYKSTLILEVFIDRFPEYDSVLNTEGLKLIIKSFNCNWQVGKKPITNIDVTTTDCTGGIDDTEMDRLCLVRVMQLIIHQSLECNIIHGLMSLVSRQNCLAVPGQCCQITSRSELKLFCHLTRQTSCLLSVIFNMEYLYAQFTWLLS